MWKNEFINLMSQPTISLEEIDRAHSIKESHIPESIFKYRAVNNYSLDNLENDTVWLCSAINYNDPYDCCSTFDTAGLSTKTAALNFDEISKNAELESHLSSVDLSRAKAACDPLREIALSLLKQDESIGESDHEKILEALKAASDSEGENFIRRMNEISQRGMKICSFSERNDSIVMWGHYSSSHTGFCIEYSIQLLAPDDPRRRVLYPVTYMPELFDATSYMLQGMESSSFNNLFGVMAASRKAPDWSYEEEWRLIMPMGESFEDRNYLMPKPSTVYLGTNISEVDEKRVREVAKRRDISVKRMRLSQREFRLIPEG